MGALALALVAGGAGCHTVTRLGAEDPTAPASTATSAASATPGGPGHGRVDRAYPFAIRPTTRAVLAALDDLKVQPRHLTIRSGIEDPRGQAAIRVEAEATNVAMLPSGERSDAMFVRHQMEVPGAEPAPFYPIYAAYEGKAADGRAVVVTVASKRGDEADNLVTARVGHRADEAWGRSFLDRVAAHLAAEAQADVQPAESAAAAPAPSPAPAPPDAPASPR